MKAKVSVEKVHELLLLSDHSPVDFDNELRVAKNALRQTETWQLQHRQELLSLGIKFVESNDPNVENAEVVDSESSIPQTTGESSTLEKLESLASSVLQLSLDFPARRSLLQRVEEVRRWQQKALFASMLFEKLQITLQQLHLVESGFKTDELSSLLSLSELCQQAELMLSFGHKDMGNNQSNLPKGGKANSKNSLKDNEDAATGSVSPMGFPLTETHLQRLMQHANQLSLSPESDLCLAVSRLHRLFQQWHQDCKLFLNDSLLAATVATHSRYLIQRLSLHPQIFQILSQISKSADYVSNSVESIQAQLSEAVSNEVEFSQQLTVMTQAATTFPFLQGPLPVTIPATDTEADVYAKAMGEDLFKIVKQLQMLEFVRIVQSLSLEMFEDDVDEEFVDSQDSAVDVNQVVDIDGPECHSQPDSSSEVATQRVLAVVCGTVRHLLQVRQVATHVSSWADLDVSYVSQLLRDTSDLLIVSRVMPLGVTAGQFSDSEADMSRWLQTCALTLCHSPRHKRDKHDATGTDINEEKETEQLPSDNDVDMNDGDNENLDAMDEDDEGDGLHQSVVYEPKGTRLSQGIVKRKEDSDFADSSKIHLHHPASAISHTTSGHQSDAQSNHKKNSNNKRKKSNDNNISVVVKTETIAEDKTLVDEQSRTKDSQQALLLQERRLDTRLLKHLLGQSKRRDDSEWALLQLCRQVDTQKAVRLMCPAVLLVTLPQSLQLWRFVLEALTDRLHETHLWQTQLRHITSQKTRDTAHGQRVRLATHLAHAMFRGLVCHERDVLTTQLQEADDWLCRARGMLAHDKHCLLDLEKLKLFVKQGESLLLDTSTEVSSLKNELKKGRNWKVRCDALLEQDAGSRDQDQLSQLSKDAEALCVDVSADLEAVSVDSRSYCLCRQMYFGDMVGCDLCDDWYHYSCANLSANQVAKCEQYTCVRCNMKASLAVGASVARQICAKWQNSEVHFEDRMNQLYKVRKSHILIL